MKVPECPKHGPMELVTLTEDGKFLGKIWFCVMDGEDGREYCDESADYEEEKQLEIPDV